MAAAESHTEAMTAHPDDPTPAAREQPSTSGRDYLQLYEDVKEKPCRVTSVERMSGNQRKLRTQTHIIDRELQRVYDASTLEEIHFALEEAGRNLQQLNIFSRVDMLVTEEPEDDPQACSVLLDLEEKNWHKIHAATFIQGSETTVEVGVGLHNARGYAEHIVASAEYGTQASSQLSLTYDQPRPWGLPLLLDARVHQSTRNFQASSSFTENMRGALLGCKSLSGVHAVQAELGWRSLTDPSHMASRAVRGQIGDYLKAAARYTLLLDQRHVGPNSAGGEPSSGWAIRACTELAGLPGEEGAAGEPSTQWAKQQLDAQLLVPLIAGLQLSITGTAGLLLPWGGANPLSKPTCIAERFFLGGPTTLRGWRVRGAGPMDTRRSSHHDSSGGSVGTSGSSSTADAATGLPKLDSLGGDAYASLLAALSFPLPGKLLQALHVHGHVFVNGGNCMQLAGTGRSLEDSAREFTSSFRWSVGVGLVIPTGFGRFEANYAHVLAAHGEDRVKRGMQFGFASSAFL